MLRHVAQLRGCRGAQGRELVRCRQRLFQSRRQVEQVGANARTARGSWRCLSMGVVDIGARDVGGW